MAGNDPLRLLQAAELYAELCLNLAQALPKHAPPRLRVQLAESAQAVSDLLAEGLGRGTPRERIHYSRMATGSLEESQVQLRRCINRRLTEKKLFFRAWNLSVTLGKMIDGFIATIPNDEDAA